MDRPRPPCRQPAAVRRPVPRRPRVPPARPNRRQQPGEPAPTLFDVPETAADRRRTPRPAARPRRSRPGGGHSGGAAVTGVHGAQEAPAGHPSPTTRSRALLDALARRRATGCRPRRPRRRSGSRRSVLRGAVLQVQQLLNVEGYAVVRIDADGATVILDVALLREQFGVGL